MISSVSLTLPSVTSPPMARCLSLRNLMSPPTLSHGPTEDMTRTSFGPHFSKASYSGLSGPGGLSDAMSGRAGTKFRVTARPAQRWDGWRGRAPSIWEGGQPMTHRPSTRAWVEREPRRARRSSLISPPEAGPVANARRATAARAGDEEGARRKKVEESMAEIKKERRE